MKTKLMTILCVAIACSLTFSNCGKKKEKENEKKEANAKDNKKDEKTALQLEAGKTPWDDFPIIETKAKEGEYVLAVNHTAWESILKAEKPKEQTVILYSGTMSKVGNAESQVNFMGTEKPLPNALIVPIPKGQSAKVGDVVLTWWQTGSGMQRAIVTDASNPKEPIVRYLDLSWDNPAKDSKSGKGIGQTEYKLKPDSFVVLNSPFQQGGSIAAKQGNDWNSVKVISMGKGKVLTLGFAGRVDVYDRKDCYTVPIKPNVKVGDKVQAVFVGKFKDATVTEVNKKMGMVGVKFDKLGDKVSYLSYGEIVPASSKLP
jgi:hypothetical protein